MKFAVIFAFFSLSAALTYDGKCPDRPVSPAVDVKKFSGEWYGIKVTPNHHHRGNDCLFYNYNYVSDQQTEVMFCEKLNGIHHCDMAKIIHDQNTGKYNATLANDRYQAESTIFHVDYETFAIIYECNNLANGKYVDNIWIMSRKPSLSAELMQEAYDKMEGYFNTDNLRSVKQDQAFCGRT